METNYNFRFSIKFTCKPENREKFRIYLNALKPAESEIKEYQQKKMRFVQAKLKARNTFDSIMVQFRNSRVQQKLDYIISESILPDSFIKQTKKESIAFNGNDLKLLEYMGFVKQTESNYKGEMMILQDKVYYKTISPLMSPGIECISFSLECQENETEETIKQIQYIEAYFKNILDPVPQTLSNSIK
ncbi:hypothetical protein WA158_002767 [Blastocystis sp. Blastoise]